MSKLALRAALFLSVALALTAAGCSAASARKSVVYQLGDPATVDHLTYRVADTQMLTRLGDGPNQRIPQNRFYIVRISVANGASEETNIPALTLVDDSGKTYEELTDGSGVNQWLGVVRRVAANQGESGTVVFDAPASHYRLKLTDDTDNSDEYIDLPLSFAHDRPIPAMGEAPGTPIPDVAAPVPQRK
ncbi:MAG TPA: DUF4352 domain-containing protein [Bryobacteraceae bacterium]|nr:DUF4352 domain-containing protein [Bryobacteraceae bacterium]